MTQVSVVVPTFNRGPRLRETVRRILASDTRGLDRVEVLVVDDGSSPPAFQQLDGLVGSGPCSLSIIRQDNAGPARARNRGFAASSGDLVLFMDDDILPLPDILLAHAEAHRLHPGSVICGRCPWNPPLAPNALFRLLGRLGHDAAEGRDENFIAIPVVASGQISVERANFDPTRGVYRDDLVTPAAEEFELSLRLRRERIPVLLAPRISALHDSPVTLAALCRQQYKHGVGCAEAACRYPETLEITELATIIEASRITPGGPLRSNLRKASKFPFTWRHPRSLLLSLARSAQALAPQGEALTVLYRLVIGVHFTAGVRDGWKRFSSVEAC